MLRSLIREWRNHHSLRFYGKTFFGEYGSFQEVLDLFPTGTPYYTPQTIAQEREAMDRVRHGIIPPYHYALSLLAQWVSGNPTILDVGGSPGFMQPYLMQCCPRSSPRITTYEVPEAVQAWYELGGKIGSFVDAIPEKDFDIVYCGSSLQYVEHQFPFLDTLIARHPRLFIIAQTPLAERSFITAQVNLRKRIVPNRVADKHELISYMAFRGYALVYADRSPVQAHFRNFSQEAYVGSLIFTFDIS